MIKASSRLDNYQPKLGLGLKFDKTFNKNPVNLALVVKYFLISCCNVNQEQVAWTLIVGKMRGRLI